MKKMKNIQLTRLSFLTVFILILAAFISSCIKDTDGAPELSPSNPVLTSVTPAEGAGGTVVTIQGAGLGDIRSVVFSNNNVPTGINSNLNTDKTIIIRVPDTAFGGSQKIVLTNTAGNTLEVPFSVIALPIITDAFPTDFQTGSTITLTGNNLDDVSEVLIEGTTDEATIVSQTRKTMVITMPASNVDNGKLSLTNVSGTIVASQLLINIDKAAGAAFLDNYMSGFGSWSWGGTYGQSTDFAILGTSSLKATYDAGGWGGCALGGGSINVNGFKYLAFWAKGASADQKFTIKVNGAAASSGSITVPANVWTYFTLELATNWTIASNTIVRIDLQEEEAVPAQTFYFDNIVVIK
jgi:hypothetical protein